MKRLLLTIIACFAFVGASMAQSALERADSLYDSGNYEEAFKLFRQCADESDSVAINRLGYMYMEGLGVEKDEKEAFRLYMISAEMGYPKAQANVAVSYADGSGVEADGEKAIEWYTKAIDNGYEEAMIGLGVFYLGKENKEDVEKNRKEFKKSKENKELFDYDWLNDREDS